MAEWKSKDRPGRQERGEVIWYSCAQATEAEGTIKIFNKAYPDIQVSQVLGPGLSARGEDQHRGRRRRASRPTSTSAAGRAAGRSPGVGWARSSSRRRPSTPPPKWRWPVINKGDPSGRRLRERERSERQHQARAAGEVPQELLGPRARSVLGRPDQAQARGVHRPAHRQHRRLPRLRAEGSERQGLRRAVRARVRRPQAEAPGLQRVGRGGARRALTPCSAGRGASSTAWAPCRSPSSASSRAASARSRPCTPSSRTPRTRTPPGSSWTSC